MTTPMLEKVDLLHRDVVARRSLIAQQALDFVDGVRRCSVDGPHRLIDPTRRRGGDVAALREEVSTDSTQLAGKPI